MKSWKKCSVSQNDPENRLNQSSDFLIRTFQKTARRQKPGI